ASRGGRPPPYEGQQRVFGKPEGGRKSAHSPEHCWVLHGRIQRDKPTHAGAHNGGVRRVGAGAVVLVDVGLERAHQELDVLAALAAFFEALIHPGRVFIQAALAAVVDGYYHAAGGVLATFL
nr:hypothetical protein [Tanacetum cinerariifolium]